MTTWDALLLVSFGGPEGPDEVMPFLRRVTAGRGVSDERLAEVGRHYAAFGGVSPINGQNRALLAALRRAVDLPVYWGNRNAPPLLAEALAEMRDDGVHRALAYVTSAYSSYSGCRQYREDIARAQREVPGAPAVDKLRVFYNHPAFVACFADAVEAARRRLEVDRPHLVFTAHSVPVGLARTSAYEMQLRAAARLVAGDLTWELAWQSRSGPPQVPWLEPDVGETLERLAAQAVPGVIVVPIGFVSDHMEVVYDLDTEAVPAARARGLRVERAATPGDDPRIVAMVADLVAERTSGLARAALGDLGPSHDACPLDCCPAPVRRPRAER
ncbi:MAG TPA: ferrochelatase [Mycobacteriales bacterium]